MAIATKVTIEIAGNKLPDFVHLTIDQTIHQPHYFQLVCRRDILEKPGDSPLSSSIKKIGSVITFFIEGINSGIDQKDLYLKGIITDVSTSESSSKQDIIFSGHSPDILLDGYPSCRSFENMTLKQIVQEVIKPFPKDQISLKGDPSNDGQMPYIIQYNETNYEFLHRIAARMGEWFFYDGQKLVFGDYERSTLKGVLGINLSNFSIGAKIVPLKFNLHRYFYHRNTTLEIKSSASDITNNLNTIGKQLQDQSLKSFPEESVNYAPVEFIKDDGTNIVSQPGPGIGDREKQKLAMGMVIVNCQCTEPLGVGNVIQIKSLDGSHNESDIGDYLVTSIHHSIDNSMNYQNTFTGIPAETKISPESDIHATARCETQSAIVKDNNDPQKWGRARVHFVWQKEGQMSPWLRIVNLYGGKDFGSYFVPEINSEVLVGFEGADPQRPYIIGPMRNKEWKPDEKWVTQTNDFKIIKTRSGHIIKFNDTKGSEKITIQAHGDIELVGNNIRFSAQNNIEMTGGNLIQMQSDQGKIAIISQNTSINTDMTGVSISADQSVDISGGESGLQIETADVTLSGTSVEIKSTTETKLGSDAIVEISGSMVKIN